MTAEVTKQPEENFAEWVYTAKDYYIDPRAMLNVDRLQQNIVRLHETGLIRDRFDVRPLADAAYSNEAMARLAR